MSMIGRIFGKREQKPVEPQKVQVFNSELWDDPQIGAFLTQMGYNPDDPKNFVTPDPVTPASKSRR